MTPLHSLSPCSHSLPGSLKTENHPIRCKCMETYSWLFKWSPAKQAVPLINIHCYQLITSNLTGRCAPLQPSLPPLLPPPFVQQTVFLQPQASQCLPSPKVFTILFREKIFLVHELKLALFISVRRWLYQEANLLQSSTAADSQASMSNFNLFF